MSFKPIDSNRDEFRKYLERSGVIEALSKVLINLFHEQDRPENAVDYLRINIGDALKDRDTIESLKQELTEARREIEELKKQVTPSNTVTVQTNTDGGGDAPVLQPAASISAVTAAEKVESQGKSDDTENILADEKVIADNTSVTDKEEIVKETDNEETANTNANNSPVESNQQQSAPVAAAIATNEEDPSKDPPKNAE